MHKPKAEGLARGDHRGGKEQGVPVQVGTQVPTPESQETPRPKSKERTQVISGDPRNLTLCPWIPPLCRHMLRGSPLLQVQASRSSDENSDPQLAV